MDVGEIVGRDDELAEIDRFLSDGGDRATVLLLEGEPGVGKTVLWDAGVAAGRARGMRTLHCRPSAAEASLSFVGLADLLAEALDDALPCLAPPRARALEAALLRIPDAATEPTGVALGLLDALRDLAAAGPLLIAVDDWQWLDQPTQTALTFAARRMGDSAMRLLCSTRSRSGHLPTRPSLDPAALQILHLRPLDPSALHALLRDRLDLNLGRSMLMRVHSSTGGNPFYALEMARALAEHGIEVPPSEPLPMPGDLRTLLSRRLTGLDSDARRLAGLAAVLVAPTVTTLVDSADDPELARAALRQCIDAGLLEQQGDAVRFEHPLLASTVLAATPAGDVRRLHATAARLAVGLEDRARHLALSASRSDSAIAGELDAAAAQAAARGAYGPAAELCELALQLTPRQERDDRLRRTLASADRHKRAGDGRRAASRLSEVVESLPAGPVRASALNELAAVVGYESGRNLGFGEQALREAAGDDSLLARIHQHLAEIRGSRGELGLSEHHAREAVRLARRVREAGLCAEALSVLGMALFDNGHGFQRGLLDEALAAAATDPLGLPEEPELSFGSRLLRAGEVEEAEPLLARALRKAVTSGDIRSQCAAQAVMAELELRRGRWAQADHQSAGALDLAEQIEIENLESFALVRRALVEAHRGRVDCAREHASRGLALSRTGDSYHTVLYESVLGFVALSIGDTQTAVRHLGGLPADIRSVAGRDPNLFPVRALAVEAVVEAGEPRGAVSIVEELEADAARSGHPWGLALASRARATAAAAAGDLESAAAAVGRALEWHANLLLPFENARCLLTHGIIQRRAKLKRPARETLEQAGAIFTTLGAPLWSERVNAELRRIGGRQPPSRQTLTPTERSVAELAASGKSNREISGALYVSVRTVEANLTRVYRKLGLRSRGELAGWLGSSGVASAHPDSRTST